MSWICCTPGGCRSPVRRAGGSCCSLVREAGGSSWHHPCLASAELPGCSLAELRLPGTSASFRDRLWSVSGTTLFSNTAFFPKVSPRHLSSSCIQSPGSAMSNPFSTFAAFGSGSWSGSTTSPSCRCPSKSRGFGGEVALVSSATRRGRQETSVSAAGALGGSSWCFWPRVSRMNVLWGTGVQLSEVLRPLPGARAPVSAGGEAPLPPLQRLAWPWLGAEAPALPSPGP